MENQFMLPIGIEDFKEIREEGYYYVDKTALIEQVLEKRSKVTLFTRPRRFGKSLIRLLHVGQMHGTLKLDFLNSNKYWYNAHTAADNVKTIF